LHQLHTSRSRSLIRHHNRLHRSPSCVEFLAVRQPLHPLSLGGISDRNGLIKILASPATIRGAEWSWQIASCPSNCTNIAIPIFGSNPATARKEGSSLADMCRLSRSKPRGGQLQSMYGHSRRHNDAKMSAAHKLGRVLWNSLLLAN